MNLIQAENIVERITYKPNFRITCCSSREMYSPFFTKKKWFEDEELIVRIVMLTRDASSSEQTVKINSVQKIILKHIEEKDDLVHLVLNQIRNMEYRETDEWFKVDNIRYNEPDKVDFGWSTK